uniref:Uncharacterized protein n=1 Tax=Anguilla anguilla TaxID=7936 RepID=A0A0E9S4T1_ANGAN
MCENLRKTPEQQSGKGTQNIQVQLGVCPFSQMHLLMSNPNALII